jgi:uncharacterized SAM-binding protein YcdF (DUF218 family)
MDIRKKTVFLLLLFIMLIWGMGLGWFAAIIPDEPASDDIKTDAIVVLTGGGLRLEHGFELLAKGRAPKMFISGVEDGITLSSLLRQKEYSIYAAKIPAGSVELGHEARSTVGNASEIAQWASHNNVSSIRLVTGNYHMPRSINEIHQAAPNLVIIPEPVFPRHFENNEWWQWADSIRLVVSEYNKYLIRIISQ